jgi:filamentous hemagglutinin
LRGIQNIEAKTFRGQLNLNGDLLINADQTYPATLTDYTINVSGSGNESVTFQQSGGNAAPVYSAGGKLTINAPNIYQQGTLKAPFGMLAFNAAKTLQLGAGSVTSVSGAGLTVPFGRGSGGTQWLYSLNNSGTTNIVINTPPEKRLELTGNDLDLQGGATIDLSGGGDLYAYEFITGPGGSNDVLDPTVSGYSQKFAVLPGFNSALTPYDPLESATSGLSNGDSVYLNAGGGLAAGWYTLLPAHYALLPGAFLITPKDGTQDQFQTTTDTARTVIVAGRYGVAGTGIQNARWQGFVVEPGVIARTRSQYTDYSANQFFTAKAALDGTPLPQIPQDAGSLAIDAKNSLALTANVMANSNGKGRGGQVDISADKLALVGNRQDLASVEAGTVGLLASDLNHLNVPSLLLGGKRSKDAKGQRVTVSSATLNIAGNVDLKGQEILLAATDQLKVASGAVVESSGKTGTASDALLIKNKNGTSDGALLRVSNAGQTEAIRDNTISGTGGVLTVESGARLKAKGSMLLDSSKDTVFDGIIDMQGGALALNSSLISVGNTPADTAGLVLTNTNFNLEELRLTSASDFDIYGAVAFNTQQLFISAANINGFNNSGASSTISADLINLSNQGATAKRDGAGTGELAFNAREIQLGSGQYAIKGFSKVRFNASEAINGAGQIIDPVSGSSSTAAPGVLSVAADIALNAGYFSGGSGATTSIDASGHDVTLTSPVEAAGNRRPGLGVRWSVTGDSIASNARFELPSGILDLKALTGDLRLDNGSSIDLSGRVVIFADTYQASAAGSLSLTANQGDINLASGADINLAGAKIVTNSNTGETRQVSDAGLLTVKAGNGHFNWNGLIDAKGVSATAADLRQGRFRLDVDSFGTGGFSALNNKLATAGFTEELTLQQRNGDITIAATDNLKAHRLELTADRGEVTIEGRIDASGAKAGEVSIYGREGIILAANGKILANATTAGNDGGKITLDTVHRDDTGNGTLNLSATGGLINVSGGAGGSGGALHLRTGRDNTNNSAFTAINNTIQGADPLRTALEATQVYDNQSTIDSTNINGWKTDTQNFMDAKPVLANNSGALINILPGIEVRSNGDLALNDLWDFMDGSWSTPTSSWDSNWRYADASGQKSLPGFLTLRAAGDLNVNASLTDAFATTPILGGDPNFEQIFLRDMIQPGQSWSYKLIAGNNVNLANSYGWEQSQVMVRTGTGDIEIAAGGDIRFLKDANNSKAAAAVYTMGTPADYTRGQLLAGAVPGVTARQNGEATEHYLARLDANQMNALLRYGYLNEQFLTYFQLFAEYPNHGGNINFSAGANIQGIQTGQKINDWLVRGGVWGKGINKPTAWGIDISSYTTEGNPRYFNQNIGALGGGNVSVEAGGNVSDLSVMIPTTGKPFGVVNDNEEWSANGTIVNGGGDLQVTAGNDIVGGEYYVGLGTGSLVAGGSIAKGSIPKSNSTIGVMLDVGDATFNVQARKDLNLATAMNPTMTKQTVLPAGADDQDTRFFSYGAESGVNLASTAGNVVLSNDFDAIKELKKLSNADGSGFEYLVYPSTLQASALSGDIQINKSMTLFPSAKGELALLANGNIGTDPAGTSGNKLYVNMADTDPGRLPSIDLPVTEVDGKVIGEVYLARELLSPNAPPAQIHAVTPVHFGDKSSPLIVAKNGSIAFPAASAATFYLPQASVIMAGKDISNLGLLAQNLSADDITIIKAGRDINFATSFDPNGNVDTVISNSQYFKLGGPGQLQVLAGHSINLGGSDGIQTIGNLLNQVLGDKGASINLLAGLSDKIDYAGFIKKYQTAYSSKLQGLAELSEEEQHKHLGELLAVLFQEIKQSAAAAAAAPESQRTALYKRGFDAINSLFPGQDYAGDLSLVFSQIKTFADGDINLAVPGGKVDVGLAGKLGGVSKKPEQLGIVVQQQGDLNILAKGDVNVNQSRLFTMGGGDIVAWSSKGDIDAGKGAKSAISAPKPVITIDDEGNIKTKFPPIVSGSGIQAIGGGNVYLAAPEGVVDAGEAGISGGKIVIAATAVIGASNIQATGGTVGVPVAVSARVSLAGANSAAASASRAAAQSAEDTNDADEEEKKKKKKTVSIISADLVGFGNCSVGDVKAAKSGCGGG